MFINYEKIGRTFKLFFPKYSKEIWGYCYEKKIEQNCTYIKKNEKKVLKKLRKKYGKEPIRVLFYVYETCRWKSQSIYDLMSKDENFEPIIIATKNCTNEANTNYQTKEDVKKTYAFFKEKGMNVKYGYDIEKDEFIPFEALNPDLIFYSHPWYVEKTQGPVVCSKFALTYYVPYFLPNTSLYIEYGLRFHQYLHKYFVLNNSIKNFYHEKQDRKSNNLIPVGHPQLDYFYNRNYQEGESVIYSPHWTIGGVNNIAYSTFDWSGKFILEFAKNHPEIRWVFKPHPLLAKQLVKVNAMTEEEVQEYYKEWRNIAEFYDCGDYLGIFDNSKAMITDCGSFLTEYLLTQKPVIHLVSDRAIEYNDCVKKITNSYYQAHNIEELENYLQKIIINKDDFKKQERLDVIKNLELDNNYCAEKILNNIKREIND